MADTLYKLFGEEFSESQGLMMARVFKELLSRHTDLVPEALRCFSCLSTIDYSKDVEALRAAPSVFINRQTFYAGDQFICIATAYNLAAKRSFISRLFRLCGEDEAQFEILGTREAPAGHTRAAPERSADPGGVWYRLFGETYHSTQAEMLYRVFGAFLERAPELADWAAEHLNCVSHTDYTLKENRENGMPSAFRSCRMIRAGEQSVCVGSGYGLKFKQNYIEKFRRQAGFPEDVFVMYPDAQPLPQAAWQQDAIRAVLRAIETRNADGRLGLILQPKGTGRVRLLGGLIRRLLSDGSWSVLLLTQAKNIAEQYRSSLQEQLQPSYAVALAESADHLAALAGRPGAVVVSTAQKLQGRLRESYARLSKRAPLSLASSMLVIVDEASSGFFGSIDAAMRQCFPNAAFLGLSIDCAPKRRVIEHFGPVLYCYSYAQALADGLLGEARYQAVSISPSAQYAASDFEQRDLVPDPKGLAEWVAEQEQASSRCALLLCRDRRTVEAVYEFLLPLLGPERLRLHVSTFAGRYAPWDEILEKAPKWTGERFPGLVLACVPPTGTGGFDVVYLAKHSARFELLTVLSLLTRKEKARREDGLLVDFCNHLEALKELFRGEYPLYTDSADTPRPPVPAELSRRLADALSRRRYDLAEAALEEIARHSPEDAERIERQLAFLSPPSVGLAQLAEYRERNRESLFWKCNLWKLLSSDSPCEWEPEDEEAASSGEEEPEDEEPATAPAGSDGASAQARGARLERAVRRLIRQLFMLRSEDCLQELRVQGSGSQFGFDVTFTYADPYGAQCTCMLECKNYAKTQIPLENVVGKLALLQNRRIDVDHWILISPNGRIGNDLWALVRDWARTGFWFPVRDVQIWTRDARVQELFGLFPELYRQFYRTADGADPADWDEEKRMRVLAAWREKLAPVPRLPEDWRHYLHTPRCLLTQREADVNTPREYEEIYRCRAAARLLDERERPIEGIAEEQVLRWLERPERPCALLLGDFGDGKSFFTYSLARQMTERFLASPKAGWIPLRLTLRELGDRPEDSRDFLDRHLREFCDGVRSWNEVSREYRFLVMLDGLDEMSRGMNDAALLDNLETLEKLIEQFRGHKLLVTSRKMVVYSDRVRDRLFELLQQPEVWHLAPLRTGDRLAFLERFADTRERKERLQKIRRTHDLMGLAAKPLFLDMMRVQLDSDEIHAMDMAGIYEDYAKKTLERKYIYQLARQGDHTPREELLARLLYLLEELAVCLQRTGEDSISLEAFRSEIRQERLARLLWDIEELPDNAEEDAGIRLTNRSLLRYDNARPECRGFCHRSMKEYFIARGIRRRLCALSGDAARELLTACQFSHEIMEFAGQELQRLEGEQRRRALQYLLAFAHETAGRQSDPRRADFARLGTNSVNLLHFGAYGLPGEDWRGLLLDNAILSEEDLSGKDFSDSSLRFSHLDNADLTGCDLRRCDFTGVQFEKSGQLLSFAPVPFEGALLACYQDGKLRRWQVDGGEVRTLAAFEKEKSARLFVLNGGREGLLFPGRLQFWLRSADTAEAAGFAALRRNAQVLDVSRDAILVRRGGELCLLALEGGAIRWRREVAGVLDARLMSETVVVLRTEEGGLELARLPDGPAAAYRCSHAGSPSAFCAAAVSDTEGVLYFESAPGKVKLLHVYADGEGARWRFGPEEEALDCGERIASICADSAEELYVGTSHGAILRYRKNALGAFELGKSYRLELKCAGARIEGVRPPEQYATLRRAVE